MSNLFKNAAIITDIHFGAKSNSEVHNIDCLEFMQWAVSVAKEKNCDKFFFLGDYHNNRSTINLRTLDYAIKGLELLNNSFSETYFIPGNHDLYYRDKRDVQSMAWAKHLPNVKICNDWVQLGDVTIAPWLIGDDHKKLISMTGKYLFGHFEIPGYLMNAMIEMPDHGEIQKDHLKGFESIFSGHFHKRQHNGNVTYIGNAFPHNYSDAGDDERGLTILEWGKTPVFYAWPDQPTYRVLPLTQILQHPETLLKPKMSVKAHLDKEVSYEEAAYIKQTFMVQHGLRDLTLIPNKNSISEDLSPGDITFESADQIIIDQLTKVDSNKFDINLLLKIYQNL